MKKLIIIMGSFLFLIEIASASVATKETYNHVYTSESSIANVNTVQKLHFETMSNNNSAGFISIHAKENMASGRLYDKSRTKIISEGSPSIIDIVSSPDEYVIVQLSEQSIFLSNDATSMMLSLDVVNKDMVADELGKSQLSIGGSLYFKGHESNGLYTGDFRVKLLY